MGGVKKTPKVRPDGKKKRKKTVFTFEKCIRAAVKEFSKKRGKDFRYQISANVLHFFNMSMQNLARRICEDAMLNTRRGNRKTTKESHMLQAMKSYKM